MWRFQIPKNDSLGRCRFQSKLIGVRLLSHIFQFHHPPSGVVLPAALLDLTTRGQERKTAQSVEEGPVPSTLHCFLLTPMPGLSPEDAAALQQARILALAAPEFSLQFSTSSQKQLQWSSQSITPASQPRLSKEVFHFSG